MTDTLKEAVHQALMLLGVGDSNDLEATLIEVDEARYHLREALGLYERLEDDDLEVQVEEMHEGLKATVTHTPSGYSTWVWSRHGQAQEVAESAKDYLGRIIGNAVIEHVTEAQPGTFMAMAMAGMVEDDKAEAWLESHSRELFPQERQERLGFDDEEYARFQADPSCASDIVASRRRRLIKEIEAPSDSRA